MKKIKILVAFLTLFMAGNMLYAQVQDAYFTLAIPSNLPTHGKATVSWYYDNGTSQTLCYSATEYFWENSNLIRLTIPYNGLLNSTTPMFIKVSVVLGEHPDFPLIRKIVGYGEGFVDHKMVISTFTPMLEFK